MAGDLIRAWLWVLVAVIAMLWLWYYTLLGRSMYLDLNMNDFGKFYFSARAFLEGGDMYGPSPATKIPVGPSETREFWNMNPPHFHLLVLPLARLQPFTGLLVWSLISVAAYISSARLVVRTLRLMRSLGTAFWIGWLFLLSSPTGLVIITGQVTFLLMLPMTWAWVAARKGHWHVAAACLGVLASVKPFIGIFLLYFVVRRRWSLALTMIASGVACIAAGAAVFGWEPYLRWLAVLRAVDWAWVPMNASMAGLFARNLDSSPLFQPLWHAPELVTPLTIMSVVAIITVSLSALSRDNSTESVDRAFAIILVMSLLVSPLGWWYYIWVVAGPLIALWKTREGRPSAVRDLMLALVIPGLILPLYVTSGFRHLSWTAPTLGSLYGWTLLWLYGSLIADWLAGRTAFRSRHGASHAAVMQVRSPTT
jgi:hypothetical protein